MRHFFFISLLLTMVYSQTVFAETKIIAIAIPGLHPYPHDPANPISVHEDYLVCRDVPEKTIKSFNKVVREMSEDGQLKKSTRR